MPHRAAPSIYALSFGDARGNRARELLVWGAGDPIMLTLAALLLVMATLLASVIPAWRAAGVEPMAALRTE